MLNIYSAFATFCVQIREGAGRLHCRQGRLPGPAGRIQQQQWRWGQHEKEEENGEIALQRLLVAVEVVVVL